MTHLYSHQVKSSYLAREKWQDHYQTPLPHPKTQVSYNLILACYQAVSAACGVLEILAISWKDETNLVQITSYWV